MPYIRDTPYETIKGYKFYHSIHSSNSARGGIGVLIKEKFDHFEGKSYQTEEIQATLVTVKTNKYSMIVAGIYCPPRHSLKAEQVLHCFKKISDRFIIGGDFNTKNQIWGFRLTSTNGTQLLEAIYLKQFSRNLLERIN